MLGLNMEPVYGIALAYVIFGEKEVMHTGFYIGLACILIAVLANGIYKLRRSKKQLIHLLRTQNKYICSALKTQHGVFRL
jgi:hypothetical protein